MRTVLKNLDISTSETSTGLYDENGKEIFQKKFGYSITSVDTDYTTDLLSSYDIEDIRGTITNGTYQPGLNYYYDSSIYHFELPYRNNGKIILRSHTSSYFVGYTARVVVRYTK